MNLKDEGFEKLQQTVNSSHHVLPNTAARGKDEIRADMQKLQKTWDDLFVNMNSAKVRRYFQENKGGTFLVAWLCNVMSTHVFTGGTRKRIFSVGAV